MGIITQWQLYSSIHHWHSYFGILRKIIWINRFWRAHPKLFRSIYTLYCGFKNFNLLFTSVYKIILVWDIDNLSGSICFISWKYGLNFAINFCFRGFSYDNSLNMWLSTFMMWENFKIIFIFNEQVFNITFNIR